VSLLLRDELRVVLGRDQMQIVRLSRTLTFKGWQYQVVDKQYISFDVGLEVAWSKALGKLEKVLSKYVVKPMSASIILSNHYVRYSIVEVDKAITSEDEQIAYVKHRFGQLYGPSADSWELKLDQEYPNASFLACAIESRLITELRGLFELANVKLISIQPCLMTAYNQCQQVFENRNVWFIIFEHGYLSIVWLNNGYPYSIRTLKVGDDWLEKLPELIDRESFLSDFDTSSKEVFLLSIDTKIAELPKNSTWKITKIQPVIPTGMAGQYDEHYSLAMCG
jgi:hypothetical protein